MLCCLLAGRPYRDKDVYHDTLALTRVVPKAAFVSVGPELARDWALQMYLGRWGDIGIDSGPMRREYRLQSIAAAAPDGYAPIPADLVRYRLYRRSDTRQTLTGQVTRPVGLTLSTNGPQ